MQNVECGMQNGFSAVVPIVAGVGNALMALPMVRQLKTRAHAGRITIVARTEAMAEPFRRVSEVDAVMVGKSLAMIRAIRSAHADLCLIPFPSNRWQYSMLALKSGAKKVLLHDYPVGYFSAMHFIGSRVEAVRGIHDVEQNLRLLRAMGIEPDLTEAPRFMVNDSDRNEASKLMETHWRGRLSDHAGYVALHAGSARTILAAAKRWPTKNYARLIETLDGEKILLEGPDESGVADEINSHLSKPVPIVKLAGNLGVAAAVLERCTIYVGSDSGLAHLAAAVGKRAVTIFAPADPDRVCPFGNRDLVVQPASGKPSFIYPWEATRPKLHVTSDSMQIESVTVQQVVSAVERAVGKT